MKNVSLTCLIVYFSFLFSSTSNSSLNSDMFGLFKLYATANFSSNDCTGSPNDSTYWDNAPTQIRYLEIFDDNTYIEYIPSYCHGIGNHMDTNCDGTAELSPYGISEEDCTTYGGAAYDFECNEKGTWAYDGSSTDLVILTDDESSEYSFKFDGTNWIYNDTTYDDAGQCICYYSTSTISFDSVTSEANCVDNEFACFEWKCNPSCYQMIFLPTTDSSPSGLSECYVAEQLEAGEDSENDNDGPGNQNEESSELSTFSSIVPTKFNLHTIYPNPFNPSTNIIYEVPLNANIEINIYNLLGEKIETVINEFKQPGFHKLTWNADDLPNGIYLVQFNSGSFSEIQKILLIK